MMITTESVSDGARLAAYMHDKKNDSSRVIELRGAVGDNLRDAFQEWNALAVPTRCENPFLSASSTALMVTWLSGWVLSSVTCACCLSSGSRDGQRFCASKSHALGFMTTSTRMAPSVGFNNTQGYEWSRQRRRQGKPCGNRWEDVSTCGQ